MRLTSKLSRFLTLCLTLALITSMLLVGTSISASAAENACPGFTTLLDGETYSSSKQYSQKSATVKQEESPSTFGNGYTWTMAATDSNTSGVTAAWLYFDAVSTAGQNGFVFYIRVPETVGTNGCALTFNLADNVSGNYNINNVGGGKLVGYTVDTDGTQSDLVVSFLSNSTKGIQLAAGFEGWVVIPSSSLTCNVAANVWGAEDRSVKCFYVASDPANGNDSGKKYYLDELGLVSDVNTAIAYFQELYTGGNEEGGEEEEQFPAPEVKAHCDGFTMLQDCENATRDDGASNNYVDRVVETSPSHFGKGFTYTVGEQNTGNCQYGIKFDATATSSKEGIAFWAGMPTDGAHSMTFWLTSDVTDIGNWTTKTGVIYYTVDDDGVLSTCRAAGQTITLPAGFSGWVVMPFENLVSNRSETTTYVDTGAISQLTLVHNSGLTKGTKYYLDEVGMVADIDAALAQLSDISYGVDYNWDAKITNTAPNSAYTTGTACDSGRGNGLKWDTPSNLQATFTGVSAAVKENGGFVFWMSIKQREGDATQPRFRVNLGAFLDGATSAQYWAPDSDSQLYMVTADGTMSTLGLKDGDFILPVNYTGWVVIPFSSMTIKNTWGSNVIFGETSTVINNYHFYCNSTFAPETVYLDEVGFTDDALGLVDRMAYNTALNATASQSSFADSHEVLDLMRTARKSIGAAADHDARKTAYDAAVANLATVCNANKSNTTYVQQRTSDSTLRFISEIDDEYLLYIKKTYGSADVEFGTLIARGDLYTKEEGDLTYTDLTNGFSGSRATTIQRTSLYTPKGIDPVNQGDTTLYTCVIRNIPQEMHDVNVRARTYVRYTDAYGVAHIVYGRETYSSYNAAVAQG